MRSRSVLGFWGMLRECSPKSPGMLGTYREATPVGHGPLLLAQLLNDDVRHDLARASSNRHQPEISPPTLRKKLGPIAISSMHLDRLVCYPDGIVAQHPFRHRYECSAVTIRAQYVERPVGKALA